MSNLVGKIRNMYWQRDHTRRIRRWTHAANEKLCTFEKPYKLHIGCGKNRFDGWVNTDLDSSRDSIDFVWDAREPFPLDDSSCSLIYHEHFLEHLPVKQGVRFLAECHRLLVPGGTLRVVMPSLETVVQKYASEDWRDQDWLTWPEYQYIQTRAEMLNISFRSWGHEWLYDWEELSRRLQEAGFQSIHQARRNESNVTELANRETRLDSTLIAEAVKTEKDSHRSETSS